MTSTPPEDPRAASVASSDQIEGLGVFYLGTRVDPLPPEAAGEASGHLAAPVLLPAKELTTHAVCVGMTGGRGRGRSGMGSTQAKAGSRYNSTWLPKESSRQSA